VLDFLSFAQAHGVEIRHLQADGVIHHCPTADKPKSRNGRYLYYGDWGWVQNWATQEKEVYWHADGTPQEIPLLPARYNPEREREERARRAQAAQQAADIVATSRLDVHPYLASKGFPTVQALIHTDGRMVVPMRDVVNYRQIKSVQFIDPDGTKKFLFNGEAKDAVMILGTGNETWLCEGYATALSLRAALDALYRKSRVVICFSAGNLHRVASMLGGVRSVMADNDESGTGERAAIATGLPWVMPPMVGDDANDLHQRAGLVALCSLLMEVRGKD